MPTKRLSHYDRESILRPLKQTLERETQQRPFPIESPEVFAKVLLSYMPESIRTAIETLEAEEPNALNKRWSTDVDLGRPRVWDGSTTPKQASICIPVRVLVNIKWRLDEGCQPTWDLIEPWIQQRVEVSERAGRANGYFQEAIWACSTAGQVKRVLPELVQILPDELQASLGEAVRPSRWPLEFQASEDHNEHLAYLAYCSLLPKEPAAGWIPRFGLD